ncbi:hypothetical protein [Mucilaginibacter myungsuensis]|uniref:Uncharacterized protein n=1 Tax=Mucilaginibacter myungsuensis TaxID=649104 RepID=A0A929PX48_9SPHI|nr:hypothetical protein [Mucilaginibacter myungsuensis]MBE9663483.1 hypothetical protein [Mucilaginibacter myungsuensis]MDN3600221.1 hypothetical protein [Mucilaginibacter myungsuensis]
MSKIEEDNRERRTEDFKEMAKNADDALVIPDIFFDEDLKEWEWKTDDEQEKETKKAGAHNPPDPACFFINY